MKKNSSGAEPELPEGLRSTTAHDEVEERDFGLLYGIVVAGILSVPLWVAIIWSVWHIVS